MNNRNDWIFENLKPITNDKDALIRHYISLMISRLQKMFKYTNLPQTIPKRELELLLQCNGFAIFTKVNNDYYVFNGGLGGEPNEYYLPTIANVNNPYLRFNKTLTIDKDCIVIPNTSMYDSLMPLHKKYAELLAENDVSIKFGLINSRITSLISADNDIAHASAEKFIDDIVDGKKLGVIASQAFFEGIKTNDYSTRSSKSMIELLESRNYIDASWYMDLGVNANYNNKREKLTDEEIGADDKTLLPLISDMLESRKIALDKINTMYGLNIGVELDDVWKITKEEVTEPTEDEIVEDIEEGEKDEEVL